MPPIPTFAEWVKRSATANGVVQKIATLTMYAECCSPPRRYPDFYSEEQANRTSFPIYRVFWISRQKSCRSPGEKQPIPKGGQVRGKTNNGKTDAGKTDSGGRESEKKGDQRKSGGGGHKSFSVEQSVKQEGNQIQAKKGKARAV